MKPIALLFLSLCCCPFGFAQKPDEDVLLLVDGEKLIGHLDHSAGSSLVFKSDLAGQITLDWSKVQELHTNSKFAVIPKGVKVHGKTGQTDEAKIPQGNLSVSNNAIAVAGTQQMVPVSDTGYLVDEDTFEKHVLTKPSFVEDWSGAVTAGATLVLATENSRSYTSAIHLARVVPNEAWFDLQSRLTVDFTSSFGEITQPGQPLVKTNILHGNIERDHYFSSRVYDYVSGGWDHNYSEGLDLQQIYGGGVGVTAIKMTMSNSICEPEWISSSSSFRPPATTRASSARHSRKRTTRSCRVT